MNRVRSRLVAVAALPFPLALAVDLAFFLAWRERLPERIATHFSGGGDADGYSSRGSFVVVAAALLVGMAVLWGGIAAASQRDARGMRAVLVIGYGVAGLIGYLMVATLRANLDVAADAGTVRLPLWQLAAAVGAGALAAGLGVLAVRKLPESAPPPGGGGPVERIDLADQEVASWSRRAPSRVLGAVSAALVVFGGVMVYADGWSGAVPLLCGLLCLVFCAPHVTVDRHGLTVRFTPLPWPRVRVPLADVERADSREVKALPDYGGWGYRVRSGRSGVILRSGEAVVVRRCGGREFAVTVDDSATAAALLNTLAGREAVRR
ncbi:DUF1648 domain-containing protein [Streptomyces sp. NPDC059009]|uniref:DUF1648 domain-containing protein n=1 Tax=Streptomyces sp. NPDC059009 TaxID=3346694 RepID=UPI0036CE08A0